MSLQDYEDWMRRVYSDYAFTILIDTPRSYSGVAKKSVVVNDSETGLEFSAAGIDNHSARHEEGGVDEVTGITGKLNNHSARHEYGGADQINVGQLSGELADQQVPKNHASTHRDGGADELDVTGLAGDLADAQDPKVHSSARHNNSVMDTPSGATFPGLSFDTWRTPNANRSVLLVVNARVVTDGGTDAKVFIGVDESGGTSRDYYVYIGRASQGAGNGAMFDGSASVILIPGASYQINNYRDPKGENTLLPLMEFVL